MAPNPTLRTIAPILPLAIICGVATAIVIALWVAALTCILAALLIGTWIVLAYQRGRADQYRADAPYMSARIPITLEAPPRPPLLLSQRRRRSYPRRRRN